MHAALQTVTEKRSVARTTPPCMLAREYSDEIRIGGWLASEKLDGVRAMWDGQKLVTRLGNRIDAPESLTRGLPSDPTHPAPAPLLDGEIWLGRGRFQSVASMIRSGPDDPRWASARFMVFDAPRVGGSFRSRLARAATMIRDAGPNVALVEHRPVSGRDEMRRMLAEVEADGGEGLVLRAPGALWWPGRCSSMLKVKTRSDLDAAVVGHQRDGRTLRALVCRTPDGTIFNVSSGLDEFWKASPPPVGSVVVIQHMGKTDAGLPRHAVFLGPRVDAVAATVSAPSAEVQS